MGKLTLQAGADSLSATKDPLLGITAMRVKCIAENIRDAIYAPCPDVGLDLVENQPRSINQRLAGEHAGYDVFITLEGSTADTQTEGEKWIIEGSTGEEAIEAHPDFRLLLELYGGTIDASTGRAKWPQLIRGGDPTREMDKNPLYAADAYYIGGITLTREYTSATVPHDLTRSLGSIDEPPAAKKHGRVVKLSGNRNWLKMRGRANWRGNVWVIEESWLMSGPRGWCKEVYRYQRLD